MPVYSTRHPTLTVNLVRSCNSFLSSAFIKACRGNTTRTSTPFFFNSFGKAPATSPRPPDLKKGAASEEANNTFITSSFAHLLTYAMMS